MAAYAGFIGIDRHLDPLIRDLSGARRDAAALWALLSDSMPELNATLLVDDDATLGNIENLITQLLSKADKEDVVILGFAGHGTRDHRLVATDTRHDALPDSTLPMADLAAQFRNSRARAIFCLLDCCFSGGAPARVLEDSVAPSDPGDPLAEVSGQGRILLAASKVDQAALEDPVSRHGLFTKALLECLVETPAPINLMEVALRVIPQVRAAAARLGNEQTPVLFGHVEGEVTLPELQKGQRFYQAFPEAVPIHVSGDFQELASVGISQPVLDMWSSNFPNGLNNLQVSAINNHHVLGGHSLLVVAPTSAGKTFIGELAAIRAIQQGEKAMFLLPYKALVNEKFEDFSAQYGEHLGLRVARCSGDWQDQTGAILRGKYDIAFFTYETFLNLSVAFPHMMSLLGLVVLDEAQFITDSHRGIVVELLLTNLVTARNRGIKPQILALSAVIGQTNAFEKWLDCGLLLTLERPVPLTEGVLDRRGQYRCRDDKGNSDSKELLHYSDIRVRRNKASSQDILVPLVRKLVRDGEKVLVFRNTRGAAAGCAGYLANELGLPAATSVLEALPQFDRSGASVRLTACLQGGTAFHSSNLMREERTLVERAFRDPEGEVRVLVATTTVAAGVNTPASTAIIVETAFFGADGRQPFTIAEYKNMAGRAGRLGFESEGKAILLAETPMEERQLYRRYVEGTPESIQSSFDPRRTGTWVIRLLAQVDRVARDQVGELLANTYGGFLQNMAQAGWQEQFKGEIDRWLARMESDGLIEHSQEDQIRLSILGRACGESPLSLESAMHLVEMMRRINPNDLSASSLMALLQALGESDADYTPMGNDRAESSRQSQLAQRYGGYISNMLQERAASAGAYYARCKRALILSDWITGVSVEDIEREYSPSRFKSLGHGDVRGYADLTRFHLGSASRIAAIVHEGAGPSAEDIDSLLKQLDLGLPANALGLTHAPIRLERGEYLALAHGGIQSYEVLTQCSRAELASLVGEARANQITNAILTP